MPLDTQEKISTETAVKTVTISAKQLKAAAIFSSNEDSRYYLQGVHLRIVDGKLTLESTDGHRLIRFTTDTAFVNLDVIIPKELIDRLKIQKRAHDGLDVTVTGAKVKLSYNGLSIEGDLIDGTYPDTDRVIPSAEKYSEGNVNAVGFNAEYLSSFADVNRVLGVPHPIKMQFIDAVSPVLVTTSDYLAVLMPMRVN